MKVNCFQKKKIKKQTSSSKPISHIQVGEKKNIRAIKNSTF